MARTPLTIYNCTLAGQKITGNTVTGTADGHSFQNTGNEFLYVENTDGAATRDVTIVKQNSVDGADFASETITVAISGWTILGPFEKVPFNTSGVVHVDFEAASEADFETMAFRFTPPTS